MASAISGRAANKHSRTIALGNGYVSHAKVITHWVADWGTPSAFDHRPSVVSGLMDLLRAFRKRIEKFLVFLLLKFCEKKAGFFLFLFKKGFYGIPQLWNGKLATKLKDLLRQSLFFFKNRKEQQIKRKCPRTSGDLFVRQYVGCFMEWPERLSTASWLIPNLCFHQASSSNLAPQTIPCSAIFRNFLISLVPNEVLQKKSKIGN